jgi:hypothetical protein
MVSDIGIETYKIEDIKNISKQVIFSFESKDIIYYFITSLIISNYNNLL